MYCDVSRSTGRVPSPRAAQQVDERADAFARVLSPAGVLEVQVDDDVVFLGSRLAAVGDRAGHRFAFADQLPKERDRDDGPVERSRDETRLFLSRARVGHLSSRGRGALAAGRFLP